VAVLVLLVLGLCLPLTVESSESLDEPTVLADLIAEADNGNQELLASKFKAQQYNSRINLAKELEDSLLAFYYLGFPARILREADPPAAIEGQQQQRAVTETVRGRALFERSTFMVRSMAESWASWYQAVSEDLHLQIIRQIKEAFFRLYFQDRIIAVTEQSLAEFDTLLNTSRDRYAVGTLSQKEVLRIQTEKSLVSANLLELRQNRLALATNLNYLAGRAPSAPLLPVTEKNLTHAKLSELPKSAAELTAVMKLERPLLKGYRSRVEIYNIMRMMIPMYYDMILRKDGFLEVESGRREVRAEMTDFQNRVSAELVTECGELTKNLELARLYGNVLLPQARQIRAAAQADFEVGRSDLRAPLQALITLHRYQTEYYQALAGYQVSLARLEAASGVPLFK